jgi:polar amino acid transport system substrate-binding protein
LPRTGAIAVGVALAGCGTGPVAEGPETIDPAPALQPAAASQASAPETCRDGLPPTASLPPTSPLPQPGSMPAGTHLAEIQRRGRLRAAVSADTALMAFREPEDRTLKGFDIDLVREVADAIFGDAETVERVEYLVINRARRFEIVERGEADIVAHTMRMTCTRWEAINISSEYFRSEQRMLVRADSPAREIEDLAGQRVCATRGSTTLEVVEQDHPEVTAVPADDPSDCLVLFQQGEVAAISSDDTVLQGLAEQDPYAEVVGRALVEQPYGLGLPPAHPELVGFLNAVLERVRTNGRWQELYGRWLAGKVPNNMPRGDHRRTRPFR